MARRASPAAPAEAPDLAGRDEPGLVITRIFAAPRRLVFKAWTDPVLAARWWGPQGFTTLACEMDVRPGGSWRRCMRSPEGNLSIKKGVYREIVPPERLVFTYVNEDTQGQLDKETLVTVTFEEEGDKTKLTLHQAIFATVAARDSHQGGWTSCLERFADYLAHA